MSSSAKTSLSSQASQQDITYSLYSDKRDWLHFRITWKIRKMSSRPEKLGDRMQSPNFFTWSNIFKAEWYLVLYPKGQNAEGKDYMSLYLHLHSCSLSEIPMNCEIRIVNDEENREVKKKIHLRHTFTVDGRCGWNKFVALNDLHDIKNNLLPGDTLTLECEGCYKTDGTTVDTSKGAPEFKRPEEQMVSHISSLLEDDTLCDVTLSTSGNVMRAHKCILAAWSSVFDAMFRHDMQENINNNVEISDVEFPVLQEMVRFMYTARKSKSLEKMADRILIAANKYNVKELEVLCEEFLIDSLSVGNVVARLVLAEMHSVRNLKIKAIKFIETNFEDVACTNSWEDLFISHPKLACEVTVKFAKYLKLERLQSALAKFKSGLKV